MLIEVIFTVTGCCSAIGNFAPGDKARLSGPIARHLVEEARCAKYAQAPVADPIPEAAPVVAVKRKKGR